MDYKNIASIVSKKTGINKERIIEIYEVYWKCIKNHIENIPLKSGLSEEEFNKAMPNINITRLGKLSCDYKRYLAKLKKYECKKDKTDV